MDSVSHAVPREHLHTVRQSRRLESSFLAVTNSFLVEPTEATGRLLAHTILSERQESEHDDVSISPAGQEPG